MGTGIRISSSIIHIATKNLLIAFTVELEYGLSSLLVESMMKALQKGCLVNNVGGI
jgi:hypothetical protein